MSAHRLGNDNRVGITTGETAVLVADGYRIPGDKSGVTYYAHADATTTALTMQAISSLPIGFRLTIDNSGGSGTLTITHDGGGTTTATTGVTKELLVAATGAFKTLSYS